MSKQDQAISEGAGRSMKVFTIGFTKKSAEEFFEKLRAAGVRRDGRREPADYR